MSNEWDIGGMYHVCKYCKSYVGGKCVAKVIKPVPEDSVYSVAEDGSLSEAIEETLNSNIPEKLIKAIDDLLEDYRLSQSKRQDVAALFEDMLPEYNDMVLKEQLDSAISVLYQNRLNEIEIPEELDIADPESFYCSKWS